MFDVKKFREILNACIGAESQVRFAEKCGLSPEHLNRMLRAKEPTRPSKTTIRKIAAASGGRVEEEELLEICGYYEDEKNYRERRLRIEERAELTAKEMREGFQALTKGTRVYSSISEFIQTFEMIWSTETLRDIRVSAKEEYDGERHPGAEYFAAASVTIEDSRFLCTIPFVVYFLESRGGNVVILDTAMDGESLFSAGALSQRAVDEALSDGTSLLTLPFLTSYKEKKPEKSAEKRLLEAIFGNDEDEASWYYQSVVGFGFYVDSVSDDAFLEFLKAHEDTFCQGDEERKLFGKAMQSEAPKTVFSDYCGPISAGQGIGAVIDKVIGEETDLPFHLVDFSEDYGGNRPCVMVESDDPNYDEKRLAPVCNRYAKELGIDRYGKCCVLMKESIRIDEDVFDVE